jgi:glutaminyl-tRNA synthetase
VVKNPAGEVTELRCTYDPATKGGDAPDGRKVRGTIHWVSATQAVEAQIRLYNPLFGRPDPGADGNLLADLNPDSLEVLTGCMLEPALAADNAEAAVQFERLGYFCRDSDSAPGHLVFNRTIGLRDSYARKAAGSA